ncbi:MAG: YbhB/YbcL family Raf kinase inhibitor-like protein [Deltaproteobacteria bacterium]
MRAAYAFIIALGLFFAFPLGAKGGDAMDISIKSPDFKDNDVIPKKFTCDGADLSPEVLWGNAPQGTLGFTLVVEDPDAPMGTFIHWVAYDIPSKTARIERGAGNKTASSFKQGVNDFGKKGYGGPCPPRGHGRHRYIFILKALDVAELGLPEGVSLKEVQRAEKGHVLAEARYTGLYQR